MKRLAWVTDIHLNFLDRSGVERFCRQIFAEEPDILLVGGDLGEADSVFGYLQQLAENLLRPVYFVLGNHDYYRGSIEGVRRRAIQTVRDNENLFWLASAGVVQLTESTALVGHGAWGDGRLGDYNRSPVMLNDFSEIRELTGLDRKDRLDMLNRLGDEAADYLNRVATEAFDRCKKLIVLTHVPPFKEACLYRGQIGGKDWLPFFTCAVVGEVLRELMLHNPDKQLTVLCGHSHHAAKVSILPNLFVHAGAAEYGSPSIQSVFQVD